MASITDLPDELVIKVVRCLDASAQELMQLRYVCRRFQKIVLDGELFRNLCFEGSIAGRRHNRSTIPKVIPPRDVQVLQAEVAAVSSATIETSLQRTAQESQQTRRSARDRELKKWNPPVEGESVDWYREYIAREARINIDWAYQGKAGNQDEIEGIALYNASDGAKQAIARFDDGRVGVWTFDGGKAAQSHARFVHSSVPVLNSTSLDRNQGIMQGIAALPTSAITDSISIDCTQHKAYIAVDYQLNEIDLTTLQLSSSTTLSRPISALSDISSDGQLFLGTSLGLHRHDSRAPSSRLRDDQTSPGHLLSIARAASVGTGSSHQIYAAGRFPSILSYDDRSLPKVAQSIYSGANLSSLSLLPYRLPQIPAEIDLLSTNGTTVKPHKNSSSHTILAAGAKNGKGSLEMYGIDQDIGSGSEISVYGNIRNRTMASRVKMLSVVPHGRRICASDADGNIKWFERDGFNLVRQVNVNDLITPKSNASTPSSSLSSRSSSSSSRSRTPPSHGGLFGARQDTGDGVQKLIPTGQEENADILLWAGTRAGVLGIGRPRRSMSDGEGEDEHEDVERDTRAQEYEGHMRKLLEAQAMEARRMQDFGL